MQEGSETKIISRVAEMSADIKNLCRSVDEVKADGKYRLAKLEGVEGTLRDVLVQATKTNGRVNRLEEFRNKEIPIMQERITAVENKSWKLLLLLIGGGFAGGSITEIIRLFFSK